MIDICYFFVFFLPLDLNIDGFVKAVFANTLKLDFTKAKTLIHIKLTNTSTS
jgi:hypothetical protein